MRPTNNFARPAAARICSRQPEFVPARLPQAGSAVEIGTLPWPKQTTAVAEESTEKAYGVAGAGLASAGASPGLSAATPAGTGDGKTPPRRAELPASALAAARVSIFTLCADAALVSFGRAAGWLAVGVAMPDCGRPDWTGPAGAVTAAGATRANSAVAETRTSFTVVWLSASLATGRPPMVMARASGLPVDNIGSLAATGTAKLSPCASCFSNNCCPAASYSLTRTPAACAVNTT